MEKFKGLKGMIILIILVLLVVSYYYHLSNKTRPEKEVVSTETLSPVQEVLARNLETNYPQTPREVVKYFSEITKVAYNEELTDEDVIDLANKIQQLYDDELIANQTQEEYLKNFKEDISSAHVKKQTVFTYTLSSSIDVETFSEDGYEWARLHCIYGMRQDGLLYNSDTLFILRKDADGHYKIYGWKLMPREKQS